MNGTLQELRYALRQLRNSPGFTVVAVLTLALGIGANVAMFTLVNALLLNTLPVHEPRRLVSLSTYDPLHPSIVSAAAWPRGFNFPMFLELTREQTAFSHLVMYDEGGISSLQSASGSELGNVMAETGDFFSTAGVPPLLGRWISPEEDGSAGGSPARVAVISYGCWRKVFAGSSAVVGKPLTIDGNEFSVIGVMPKEFIGLRLGAPAEATIPLTRPSNAAQAGSMSLPLLGQLRPRTTIESARTQMETIWERIKIEKATPPESHSEEQDFSVRRIMLRSASTGFSSSRELYRKPIFDLWMMVGIVLLIACTNLGTLMLARMDSRRHALAIRAALGAPRPALLRQSLMECFLLALAGIVPGLLIACYASRWLASQFWLSVFPMDLSFAPDSRVLAFAIGATVLTVFLFGTVPSWIASRADPGLALQSAGRALTGRSSSFTGNILLAGQIALSVALLMTAVQLVFSAHQLLHSKLGLQTDGVFHVQLIQRGAGYKNFNAAPYYRSLQQQIEAIPGIASVGMANANIFSPYTFTHKVANQSGSAVADASSARPISPGFLSTLQIPFESGRDFRFSDDVGHPAVAIINRSLASQLFPTGDPIGQHVHIGDRSDASLVEVVGVVADANLDDPRHLALPAIYVPFFQKPDYMRNPDILLRVSGDPAQVQASVRQIVTSMGREDVFTTETLNHRLYRALLTERMLSLLATCFGLLALLLICIGTVGLFSCMISRRIPEIGLRMVFGARRINILAMILKHVGFVVVAGTAAGIPLAWMALHQLNPMLYRRIPFAFDLIAVWLTLLFASLLAALIPARRAAKVDPMVALRYE